MVLLHGYVGIPCKLNAHMNYFLRPKRLEFSGLSLILSENQASLINTASCYPREVQASVRVLIMHMALIVLAALL